MSPIAGFGKALATKLATDNFGWREAGASKPIATENNASVGGRKGKLQNELAD